MSRSFPLRPPLLIQADDAWTVQGPGEAVVAPVPGCVHQALMQAGRIADPNGPGGEAAQEWVGLADWTYRGCVRVPPEAAHTERVDLVFESIDCAGEVFAGDRALGSVANQHHPHEFDVAALVRQLPGGALPIEVRLRSPVKEVRRLESELGARPVNGDWTPYVFLRKAACNFGWDWGPKVATCGLGRVWLRCWSLARITAVRPLVRECTQSSATVEVCVDVELAESARGQSVDLQATLRAPSGRTFTASARVLHSGGATTALRFSIDSPERWWPRGQGEQALHGLHIELLVDRIAIDQRRTRIGLRSVRLDTAPDARGAAFALVVNDRRNFCQGANWVPAGLFAGYASDELVRAQLDSAAECGLNALRVWGGGVYESESFYNRCDELGLLVWHDFMFACATYPEDDPFPQRVEAEARHQIARLATHPSVALWCGGNENIWAWKSWGFGERLKPGQSWGKRYWLELLPRLVAELDPSRPYWPDSPWSGALEVFPNDADRGDCHAWDRSVEAERDPPPRFISEFGRQGYPNYRTLQEALPDAAQLQADSVEMRNRQKGTGGDDRLMNPALVAAFAPASDFADRVFHTQLLQAWTARRTILWARANPQSCAGALVWQWNDAWAGHGFGALDSAQRPKPMWFAMQQACASRALAICRFGQSVRLMAMNDCADEWLGTVTLMRVAFNGKVRQRVHLPLHIAGRATATIADVGEVMSRSESSDDELLVADCGATRAHRLPLAPRELKIDAPRARVELLGTSPRRSRWRVHAQSVLIDAWLEPQGEWSGMDTNLLTLLEGETADIEIRGGASGVTLRTATGRVES